MPTRSNPWKIGFLILAIAVVLWVAYAVTVPRLAMSWEKANQFGGMFGGIGALFSGLALGGVVAAIWLQKQASEALAEQIELMSVTAQLTALDTLYRYHAERLEQYLEERPVDGVISELDSNPALTRRIREAEQKRNRVLERIDTLITDLERRSRADAVEVMETSGDSPAGK